MQMWHCLDELQHRRMKHGVKAQPWPGFVSPEILAPGVAFDAASPSRKQFNVRKAQTVGLMCHPEKNNRTEIFGACLGKPDVIEIQADSFLLTANLDVIRISPVIDNQIVVAAFQLNRYIVLGDQYLTTCRAASQGRFGYVVARRHKLLQKVPARPATRMMVKPARYGSGLQNRPRLCRRLVDKGSANLHPSASNNVNCFPIRH